jgi:uncharacterized protein (DUF362 family)
MLMDRRDFLKSAAVAGLGMAFPGTYNLLLSQVEAAEKTDLVVARGASPSKTTLAAMNAMGGIKRFISRGDIVVVKPNIGWDRTPEYAANTNPEVVATLVRLCYEAGAKKVKVFDYPVNDARRCYKQSGIADAARAAGAEVSFVDERKFKDVRINGMALKSWPLYKDILETDKIINVPIAKTHGLTTLTLGMKNWMGVMGGWRSRLHHRIDENLVDVSRAVKPTLVVLDAVRILTANGPQGGDLDDVKKLDTIIVGTDQVAVDTYGATLFGIKGADLGYVKLGNEVGLGTMNLSRLKIRRIQL